MACDSISHYWFDTNLSLASCHTHMLVVYKFTNEREAMSNHQIAWGDPVGALLELHLLEYHVASAIGVERQFVTSWISSRLYGPPGDDHEQETHGYAGAACSPPEGGASQAEDQNASKIRRWHAELRPSEGNDSLR